MIVHADLRQEVHKVEVCSKHTRWMKALGWIVLIPSALIVLALLIATLIYPFEYVRRVLVWQETDIGDFLNNFPNRPLNAPSTNFTFETTLDKERVSAQFEAILKANDFDAFLQETGTQAFIVIQDDAILYEEYFNGAQRDSMLTSYSVAKSFTTALIGIAIEEGAINSIDDPITRYLPELAQRDPRFQHITLRHLMMMASGLDFEATRPALFNGDDPLTSYYPDQRQAALEFTEIVDPPGTYFSYNKYHPQLLGMILERATGKSVTQYTQEKLWTPLGMEFDGSWSLDSEDSGFEKMEAGVNARAIDYAKLGRLYLQNGNWNGQQVIPAQWIADSTQVDQATYTDSYYSDQMGQELFSSLKGYYKYMWYGYFRGENEYDFAAEGDHGQFIYVSPYKNLVIVRNGLSYGESMHWTDWIELFYQFATEL